MELPPLSHESEIGFLSSLMLGDYSVLAFYDVLFVKRVAFRVL
jgi:hypothetical protein